MAATALPVVLASTSTFRRKQLQTWGLPFECAAPEYDETPLAGEAAAGTARRLAAGKARSLAARFPACLIIGADQVAWSGGRQLGKPMTPERAQTMLESLSGQSIVFYSAVCLLNTATGRLHEHTDTTVVQMRRFDRATVARYLQREPDAMYCAGGAKSEALGSALIERIDSSDPNALIGLPLLRLADFLAAEGVCIV
ncbi:Maf family protein [Conchiformibius kuhniae]|uniref:7-methyl-GTP pyrophosphatase n=1 Tax=Conchiformibius kuhniae TaxID=211502 RepID=A0A8T9MVW2_9NEIS|nr:nucleoside triphosphate pyrophosphatase [Conchiformibius kuhniae]UOP04302.1 Maf family nucleotide pyrophosphatase [Conchiformibius kuhniae]